MNTSNDHLLTKSFIISMTNLFFSPFRIMEVSNIHLLQVVLNDF